MTPFTSSNNSTQNIDPVEAYDDKLRESDILDYTLSRETMEGMGNPALPQVLQLSTVQEAQMYLQLSQTIRMEAGEIIGISRQRLGQMKPSETATGVNKGLMYSEAQTEKYYEQHSNLMQRVRQRMLDAAQYFSTFKESSRSTYLNEMEETKFLEIEGMDNLFPHYSIFLQSRANVRAALQTISDFLINENTLPISPSVKIQAIVENSIPKIISLIKTSELDQQYQEQLKQQQEQTMQQQQQQHDMQMQAQNQQHQDAQKELDRESAERVASIRALGGMQTDVDANGQTDASQNLDSFLKSKQVQVDEQNARSDRSAKEQVETNRMIMDREDSQMQIEKEKVKGEYALKVAKTKAKPKKV